MKTKRATRLFDDAGRATEDAKAAPKFGGETFDAAIDGPRLTEQLRRVIACVRDGKWRTLRQISDATGDPEASVSTRLRDLRKDSFGIRAEVSKRRGPRGRWEYRVDPSAFVGIDLDQIAGPSQS